MPEKDPVQQFSEFLDLLNTGLERVSQDLSNITNVQDLLQNVIGISESMKGFFDQFTQPFMNLWAQINNLRRSGEQVDIIPIQAMEESMKEMLTFKNIFARRLSPRRYFRLEVPEDIDESIRIAMNSFNQIFSESSKSMREFRNVFTSLHELTLPRQPQEYIPIIEQIKEGLTPPEEIKNYYNNLRKNIISHKEKLENQLNNAQQRLEEIEQMDTKDLETYFEEISLREQIPQLSKSVAQINKLIETMDQDFGKKMKTYENAYNIMNNIMERVSEGATPLEAVEAEFKDIARRITMESLASKLEKNFRIFERFNLLDFQNIELAQIPEDQLKAIQDRIRQIFGQKIDERQLENYIKLYYKFFDTFGNVINQSVEELGQNLERGIQLQALREVLQTEKLAGKRPFEAFIDLRQRIEGVIPQDILNEMQSEVARELAGYFSNLGENIRQHLLSYQYIGKRGRNIIPSIRFLPQISGMLNLGEMASELAEINLQYSGLLSEISNQMKDKFTRDFEGLVSDKYREYDLLRNEIYNEVGKVLGEDVSGFKVSDIIERLGRRFYDLPQTLQRKLLIGEELEQSLVSNIVGFEFFKEELPSPKFLFRELISQSENFIKQLNRFSQVLSYRSGYKIMPLMDIGLDMGGFVPQPDINFGFRMLREFKNIFTQGLSPQFIQNISERLMRQLHILQFDQYRVDILENIRNIRRIYEAYDHVLEKLTGRDNQEFLNKLHQELLQRIEEPFRKELPQKLETPEEFRQFREFLTKYGLPEIEGVNVHELRENIQGILRNFNQLAESLRTGRIPFTESLILSFRDFSSSMAMFFRFMGQMGGWMMGMPAMSAMWMVSYQPTMAAMQVTQPVMWGLAGLTGGTLFYRELMGFLYRLPERMVQIQEQFITMSTLMGSRILGREALAQAMEIARWQPIQFEEAIQTITAFTIFPETRTAIRIPQFQRQVMETVQLLSMLVPEQGIEGAIFAIRELLGNQFRSIERRFNISRELLASFAEVSVEEFKDLPGPEKLRALHRALSEMFAGGEEILLQRGMMFDVQIRNFTDTLIRSIFPAITMEPQRIVREQLTRMFVNTREVRGDLLQIILGPVWERYRHLARVRFEEEGITPNIEQINQRAFSLVLQHANTLTGMLSIMFSGLNNILSQVIEQTDIGDLIARNVNRIISPFMGPGGFIERWAERISMHNLPQGGEALSEFIRDLINTTNQSIEEFGMLINKDEIRIIFNDLAMTIMNAMMTAMEMPMKIATVGGIKLTTMFPRIMGETVIDAFVDMFRSGRRIFSPTDIIGTLFTIHGFTSFMRPDVSTMQAFSRLALGMGISLLPRALEDIRDILKGNVERREQRFYDIAMIGAMIASPLIERYVRTMITRIPWRELPGRIITGIITERTIFRTTPQIIEGLDIREFTRFGKLLFTVPMAIDVFREISSSGDKVVKTFSILSDVLGGIGLLKGGEFGVYLMGAGALMNFMGLGANIIRRDQLSREELYRNIIGGFSGALLNIGGALTIAGAPASIGIPLIAIGALGELASPYIAKWIAKPEEQTQSPMENLEDFYVRYYSNLTHMESIYRRNLESFFKKYSVDISKQLYEVYKEMPEIFETFNIENILDPERLRVDYINYLRNRLQTLGRTENINIEFESIIDENKLFTQNREYIRKLNTEFFKSFGIQLPTFEEFRIQRTSEFLARIFTTPQRIIEETIRNNLENLFNNILSSNIIQTYRFENDMGTSMRNVFNTLGENIIPKENINNVRDIINKIAEQHRLNEFITRLTEILKLRSEIINKGLPREDLEKIENLIRSGETTPNIMENIDNMKNINNATRDMLKRYSNMWKGLESSIRKIDENLEIGGLVDIIRGIPLDRLNKAIQDKLNEAFGPEQISRILSGFYLEEIKPPEMPRPLQIGENIREFTEKLRNYYQQIGEWLRSVSTVASPQGLGGMLMIGGFAQSMGITLAGRNPIEEVMNRWFDLLGGMIQNPQLTLANPLDIIRRPEFYLGIGIFGRMGLEERYGPELATRAFETYISEMLSKITSVTTILNPENRRTVGEILSVSNAQITIGNANLQVNASNVNITG